MGQNKLQSAPSPRLVTHTTISHPNRPATVIGFVCEDTARGRWAALMKRTRDEHYFRKHSGYAISEEVLDALAAVSREIEDIHVMEMDTRDLLEYDFEDFTGGEMVVYDTKQNTVVEGKVPTSPRYDVQFVAAESEAEEWADEEYELELKT